MWVGEEEEAMVQAGEQNTVAEHSREGNACPHVNCWDGILCSIPKRPQYMRQFKHGPRMVRATCHMTVDKCHTSDTFSILFFLSVSMSAGGGGENPI